MTWTYTPKTAKEYINLAMIIAFKLASQAVDCSYEVRINLDDNIIEVVRTYEWLTYSSDEELALVDYIVLCSFPPCTVNYILKNIHPEERENARYDTFRKLYEDLWKEAHEEVNENLKANGLDEYMVEV